jgi:hypothetical protein
LSDCDDRTPAAALPAALLTVKRTLRTLLPLCALAALVGLAVSGPAAAATPCWKTLINDWYDGRIDGTYAIPCYQQAIKHLPTDVKEYSSAADDIQRALQARLSKKSGKGTAVPGSTNDKGGGTGSSKSGKGPKGGGNGSQTTTTPATTGRQQPRSAIPSIINAGNDHPDSVPIPLIVLGGIAGLLLAAGSAGLIARRVQARRVPRPPAT